MYDLNNKIYNSLGDKIEYIDINYIIIIYYKPQFNFFLC